MKEANFSSRIKDLRVSLGLTQVEFAEKIGTTQATLSSYENTDKTPSLDIVKNIADTFSISIDWLLGRSEKQHLSSNLETYTDLIEMIMRVNNAPEIWKKFSTKPYTSDNMFHSSYSTLILEINDKHLVNFYEEWQEISSIRSKTPSGDKLYDIWLKDIYERFNFKLENAKQSFNDLFPDDDELPFH